MVARYFALVPPSISVSLSAIPPPKGARHRSRRPLPRRRPHLLRARSRGVSPLTRRSGQLRSPPAKLPASFFGVPKVRALFSRVTKGLVVSVALDPEPVAELTLDRLLATIRGRWHVRASTSRAWLSGARESPVYSHELISENPPALKSNISWITMSGDEKHLFGTNRWHSDHFSFRRSRLLRTPATRWTPVGASVDGNIMVIRFDQILASLGGVDVLVRDDVTFENLRRVISHSPDGFGLNEKEFERLSWLIPDENR